jgi:cupredoxin-like protein
MRKRYGALFVMAMVAAVVLSILRPAARSAPPVASVPSDHAWVRMRIEVRGGVVSPATTSVPKDHRVALEIVNHGAQAASVRLAGYEDRVATDLAPGATTRIEFLADRPGEDFPWLVDGRPSGRFVVAGAHLAERRR